MYSFYIDGELLPVTPSKVQTKISNNNKTMTLINDGEINIPKKPGLIEIDFEALFPQINYPFAVYSNGFKSAEFFVEKLKSLKASEKPFQFIILRSLPTGKLLFDTNIRMLLEEFSIKEDVSNGFDVMVQIKLKQYKEYGTKTISLKTNSKGKLQNISNASKYIKKVINSSRELSKSISKTYTVSNNDTLWTICKRELGDGSKYKEVAKLNGIDNPNKITVGQVIRLE